MSELGTTVYSVLLVWMRAVNDWFWSMLSGGGSALYKLVLSHWKTWLIVLVAAGLVIDWLVWLVRWRPMRLIFGKRVTVPDDEDEEPEWDLDNQPYYGPDDDDDISAMTVDQADWTDNTLRTLSEIDPDWAENLSMDAPEVLEENPPPERARRTEDPWAETPDEYDEPDYYYSTEADAEEYAETPAFTPLPLPDEEPEPQQPSPALFEADADDEAMEGGTRVFGRASAPVKRYARPAPEEAPAAADDEPLPAWDDPDETPYAAPPTRRRRRSIRAAEEDAVFTGYDGPTASHRRAVRDEERPVRLVAPEPEPQEAYVKLPRRKRMLNLSGSDDDAIPGLPPMEVDGGGFRDAVMPDGTKRSERKETI